MSDNELIAVNSRIGEMMLFIREKTSSNLLESSRSGDLALNGEELRKVTSLVDRSISQAFSLSVSGVESALKELIASR